MSRKFRQKEKLSEFSRTEEVDLARDRIAHVVEWTVKSRRGIIVALHGKNTAASSCRIYESVDGNGYQLVTGDPACNFVGEPVEKIRSGVDYISFGIQVGQGYGSPRGEDEYELSFDGSKFCSAGGVTNKCKSSVGSVNVGTEPK
ncbi:hypothetical protein PQR75_35650 [Paraburkholderia fungorum]|uniref:hypothetical protein n=1 Tax=Paraburkholderia fungorum TaxID=134537 RepID=UPI0038B70BBA